MSLSHIRRSEQLNKTNYFRQIIFVTSSLYHSTAQRDTLAPRFTKSDAGQINGADFAEAVRDLTFHIIGGFSTNRGHGFCQAHKFVHQAPYDVWPSRSIWRLRIVQVSTLTISLPISKSMFSQPFNPFTPKSDQFQISPAASPEIVHHTV